MTSAAKGVKEVIESTARSMKWGEVRISWKEDRSEDERRDDDIIDED